MCLILFSWQQDPLRPLVVAANRDEYFERPTAAADFWDDHPQILAGRDLEHGGSWLGISQSGRFAAVTNLRNVPHSGEASRGNLVRDFLLGNASPAQFLTQLESKKPSYRPFNLLVCDGIQSLAYTNNVRNDWCVLAPGHYVLGNSPLDDHNAKTQLGLADFTLTERHATHPTALLDMLQDDAITEPDGDELQQMLSSRFVRSATYGTRSSSVLFLHSGGGWDFWEQAYDRLQAPAELRHFRRSAD